MAFLSTLDPAIFLYIIKSISEGLAAEGMTNLTSSDATGDLSNRALSYYSFCFELLICFLLHALKVLWLFYVIMISMLLI